MKLIIRFRRVFIKNFGLKLGLTDRIWGVCAIYGARADQVYESTCKSLELPKKT